MAQSRWFRFLVRWARRLLLPLAALAPLGWLAGIAAIAWAAARPRPAGVREQPIPPPGLPPGRVVEVPGVGELFVRDTGPPDGDGDGDGPAPTIVLLHGWMLPADATWFPSYGPLSRYGRVLAVDHRGHGRGLRPSAPFRLSDAADDVAALLRHLGTGPVVAVGFSMGGPVAQLLWQRHPDLVRGLVLIASSATFNTSWRDRYTWRSMGLLQLVLRIVPRLWWERLLGRAAQFGPSRIRRVLRRGVPEDVRRLLPWFVSELDRGSAEDVAEAGRELSRFDAREWIADIDVPVAVLVTMEDALVPRRNQLDLARRIPQAVVRELALEHDGVFTGPATFLPALRWAVEHVLGLRPATPVRSGSWRSGTRAAPRPPRRSGSAGGNGRRADPPGSTP